jgi:ABC-type multidrug transport system fused ATPase/permease subunit
MMFMECIKNKICQIIKFKRFLGPEVSRLFAYSVCIGVLWFCVEASFIVVLQVFLKSLGFVLAPSSSGFADRLSNTGFEAGWVFIFFGFFRGFVFLLKYYFAEKTNQSFVKNLRDQIFEYAIDNRANVSAGDVINTFNERVPSIASVVQQVTVLINSVVSSLFLLALCISIAPKEFLLCSVCLLIFSLPLRLVNLRISTLGKIALALSKDISNKLTTALRNNLLLVFYGMISGEVEIHRQATDLYKRNYEKYSLMGAIKSTFPLFAGTATIGIVTLYSNKHFDTTGVALVSFIYLFMRFAQGLSEINQSVANVRFNRENIRDLYQWFLRHTEYQRNRVSPLLVDLGQDSLIIEARSLNFDFEKNTPILKDVNLRIQTGDVLVIYGASGSGKSTLIKLICGIFLPTSGDVFINGHNTRQIQTNLRNFVGYVGPEPYLIEGTIRENMRYGAAPNAISDDLIESLIQGVFTQEEIETRKLSADFLVGDVAGLSTGQKQRVCIARALARKPKLLILDEATANLDPISELMIVENIKSISNNTLVVVISHKRIFDDVATKKVELGGVLTLS